MSQGREAAIGTLKVFAGEALVLPTGVLVAAFLARQLGPTVYGLYLVAATIAIWIELATTQVLSRTTVKFVAEAANWQGVASTAARTQLLIGLGASALLVIGAPYLALLLGTEELATYFRLFALDIPLFALAHAHRSILVGQGAYGRRARLGATRWLSRMVLIFLLVGLGFSITGAIVAWVGASILELILARTYIRPSLLSRSHFPVRRLWGYSFPLFFHAVSVQIFGRLGLPVVVALSVAPEAAGYYGAAQDFAIVPGLFASSLSMILLATLTRVSRHEQVEATRAMSGQAMRLVLCSMPFAGIVAGSAPEIVALIYGDSFLPAGPLATLLVFSAVALMMISVNSATLTAAGRPGLTFAMTGPLVPLALGAHLVLVPRVGPIGAAAATTAISWLGAATTSLAVSRQYGVSPALAMWLRTALVTLIVYLVSTIWRASGGWLFIELIGLTGVILVGLLVSGELTRGDLAFGRSLLMREQRRS